MTPQILDEVLYIVLAAVMLFGVACFLLALMVVISELGHWRNGE